MFFRFLPLRQRSKESSFGISVEIKIIGFMDSSGYVNVITQTDLPAGATVKDLIKAAKKQGAIAAPVYRFVKGVKPPLSLMINGKHVTNSRKSAILLNDGDKVTIFTPVSGG